MTLKYMKRYGIDNVRGESYSRLKLTETEKKEIEKHIRNEYNLCFVCGEASHFSNSCECHLSTKNLCTRFTTFFTVFFTGFFKNIFNPCTDKKSETVLNFGKYNGYTYKEVYTQDQSYCNWVLSGNSTYKNLNEFKNWLRTKTN